ncbi:hypothetical protein N7492_005892 [Penicillium capsulatum]|uniref:Uncharacterized protein n=1 Tax=Penicillium capsulatum TaxID=69766 RepID=A0A9W9IC93_9EURO|nr:hypothetical protein N7492_005892 [Penicillium capsulatum]KAJ6135006.1 hypothetical protein N7512_000166 [Penicillium capsulatum]
MADVRSMLRNELASRKGTSQPNTTGNRISKKRKVDNGDGLMRKKLRSTDLEAFEAASGSQSAQSPSTADTSENEGPGPVEEDTITGPELPDAEEHNTGTATTAPVPTNTAPSQEASKAVDEDEWAAFEREVAAPSRVPHVPAALAADATISAAPVSTEELATQQERDKTSTARAREAEFEGEREDAARFMEEEFDEMDQLEERVRKLKHMREELRQKRANDDATRDQSMITEEQRTAESEGDEEDDEDWDDWRFK